MKTKKKDLDAIAFEALARLKTSLEQRGVRPEYITHIGEGDMQKLDVPLLEVRRFVGYVFGIRLGEKTEGGELEVRVSANYRINDNQQPAKPDVVLYEQGLRKFYQKTAKDILNGFVGKDEDPFIYKGLDFQKLFTLERVECREITTKKKRSEGKFRYIFEGIFSISRRIEEIEREALVKGLYLYCLRGFIAHHSGYAKDLKI